MPLPFPPPAREGKFEGTWGQGQKWSHLLKMTDEEIKEVRYMYTIEYYLAIKKETNTTICNNMDGPGGCYAKWNKSDKDTYHMISFICGI